ncbi:MAG: long-chain fatty acid--CoA ligase [Acidimicrobiia bacterium]|nr:long-chain fatty acid--CoA ligase [Acidimicrobiia bacterium]
MGDTIITIFNERAAELGDAPALRTKTGDGKWSVRTWADYSREVRSVASWLADAGVGPGVGVAVLSGNRAEYHVADLAAIATGAVAVPIYHSNSPEQVRFVLEHSDASVVFVENAAQAAKVAEIRKDLPDLETVITFTDGEADHTYEDVVARGREIDEADPAAYEKLCARAESASAACYIYTSGTTGPPKGAIITHANVLWTGDSLSRVVPMESPRFISFLPLAHIAERMVSHYAQIFFKGETWFGGGIDTLRDDLAAVRPTTFFAVPRVYEKFEAAIRDRFDGLEGIQGKLARSALETGTRVVEARVDGRTPGLLDRVKHRVLDRLVSAKLRHQVGFDQVDAIISGAAPITIETLVFFHALGLPIAEVYGQTEDCGPTSLNPPGRIKIGTVGPPIPGEEVRIADDGEILVRGGNVFAGYFKNPEATAETLVDGWLYTGDLGEIDDDGYLRIVGRKKDLIITAGGKNVSPQNLESSLKAHPLVSQAVVIGDRRKFLSALVTLDAEAVAAWADKEGLSTTDPAALAKDPKVLSEIEALVDEVSASVSKTEGIKKFTVLPEDFTQEAGEVTPTLKVRRHRVEENYSDAIEAMYK